MYKLLGMGSIFLFATLLLFVEIGGLWLYLTFVAPKKKTLQKIVSDTGLESKTVKEYLKYVSQQYINKLISRGITLSVLKEISKKYDLRDGSVVNTILSNRVLSGEEYLKWIEKDFTLEETGIYGNYGLNMEEAFIFKTNKVTVSNVQLLSRHRIDKDEAIGRIRNGKSAVDIVLDYSAKIGLKPDERLEYIDLGIVQNEDMSILREKGMTPFFFSQFQYWGKATAKKVLERVKEGKFDFQIYRQWHDEGFTNREIGICLENGYPIAKAKNWRKKGLPIEKMDLVHREEEKEKEKEMEMREKEEAKQKKNNRIGALITDSLLKNIDMG